MPPPFGRLAMRIMGSLLAWMACFTMVYVLGAISCAHQAGRARVDGIGLAGAASLLLVLATAAFTAWQMRTALQQRRQRSDQNTKFARFLVLGLGAIGLMGLAMLALAVTSVHPHCAGQPALVSSAGATPPYAISCTGPCL